MLFSLEICKHDKAQKIRSKKPMEFQAMHVIFQTAYACFHSVDMHSLIYQTTVTTSKNQMNRSL